MESLNDRLESSRIFPEWVQRRIRVKQRQNDNAHTTDGRKTKKKKQEKAKTVTIEKDEASFVVIIVGSFYLCLHSISTGTFDFE